MPLLGGSYSYICAIPPPRCGAFADAIETAAGQSYPDLRARVTAPLGMVDTGFTPTPEQGTRLMTGSGQFWPAFVRNVISPPHWNAGSTGALGMGFISVATSEVMSRSGSPTARASGSLAAT
jgi:CubicO group peptidase (beta-lactamase class C family)